MRVSLYLLNKKGLTVLQRLVSNMKYLSNIDLIITTKDKGNKEDCYDEIRNLAKKHNLKVYDRKDEFQVSSDYSIAVGWRWLLDYKNTELIVIHDSLLPKYRGFSPLVNMLINKEKKIGATMIFASKYMDEGAIISQKSVDVNYPIKIKEAIDLIAGVCADLIGGFFEDLYLNKKIIAKPQNHKDASYSIWRDGQDYRINWKDSASSIKQMIDAVGYPYANAKTKIGDTEKLIDIIDAEVVNNYTFELNHEGKIFKIEDGNPLVVCGNGLIKITNMLDENGRKYKLKNLRTRFK